MKSKYEPLESQRIVRNLFILVVAITALGLGFAGSIFWYFSRNLPQIITVADYHPPIVTRVLAANGKENAEIGEFFKERRYLIPFEKIPDQVVKAFIAAEDDRFFEHPGINILSMVRAGIANFRAGHVVQGGSTITQQVAKSLLLTPERSFDRKIKEVIIASRIERNLTKAQILYLYLNQIYLGKGAYGVQAAGRVYFHKDVSKLTLAEAALLAGLPQAPGKYSPLQNPKKAKERQTYVLKRMYENKWISLDQMNEAIGQPLRIYLDEDLNKKYAPYYVEYIRKYLMEKYGEKALYEDGLTVTVPMTPELALSAERSLKEGLRAVDKRAGFRGAIKHLDTDEEIEKFLVESKAQLLKKGVGFQVFLPDGRIGLTEALELARVDSMADLIRPSEPYQAVVTRIEDKSKLVRVSIGPVQAELSVQNMKWIRPIRPDSIIPSKVFKVGDVIWVTAIAGQNRSNARDLQVALEQEPMVQGALISIDARTGFVLGMVGGYDFEKSEFNRAIQALRQVGSAFKPIIYASALEKGFTPASIIVDSPIVFKTADGAGSWKPNNFEETFYGDTTFRQALIKSRNIPTIKIVQSVQVPYLIDYARRLGMNAQFNPDLSISLGSASVSLLDLTKVYSVFPRLGRKVIPIFFTRISDRDGKVLESYSADENKIPENWKVPSPPTSMSNPETPPSPTPTSVYFPTYPLQEDPDQVLDPRVSYVMTHLMKEAVAFGTGHEARNLGRTAAGKTGTTNDYNDAWFLGFTPHVVTGVWVGYDNQKSIGNSETGAKAALPIWLSFMKDAVKSYPDTDFSVPPGIVFANIDPRTGKLSRSNSSTAIREAFVAGTEPTESGNQQIDSSESQADFLKEDKE